MTLSYFADKWLLAPKGTRDPIDIEKTCRINTHVLFLLIEQAVFHVEKTQLDDYSRQLKDECRRVLVALEVLDESGYPGARIEDFRHAWLDDDYDWFHGQFLAIPMYREVLGIVRSGNWEEFQGHHGCYLTLARRLGQVARLDFNQGLIDGSDPLSGKRLIEGLSMLIPSAGTTISIYNVCRVLCRLLHITPARLETALISLRDTWHGFPFEKEGHGGRREPGMEETILRLTMSGFDFREVSSGQFKMTSPEGSVVAFTQIY